MFRNPLEGTLWAHKQHNCCSLQNLGKEQMERALPPSPRHQLFLSIARGKCNFWWAFILAEPPAPSVFLLRLCLHEYFNADTAERGSCTHPPPVVRTKFQPDLNYKPGGGVYFQLGQFPVPPHRGKGGKGCFCLVFCSLVQHTRQ